MSGVKHMGCEECGNTWKEHSRDVRSMSGSNCPRCGAPDGDVQDITEDAFWTQDIRTSTAAEAEGLLK